MPRSGREARQDLVMYDFFVLMQEIAAEKNRGRGERADHQRRMDLNPAALDHHKRGDEQHGRDAVERRVDHGEMTPPQLRVGWVHVHHPTPPVVPASQVESTTRSCIDLLSALS